MKSGDLHVLAETIGRHALCEGVGRTAIPGLKCVKISAPGAPLPVLYEPCLCLIARGSKTVALGRERYGYAAGDYLIVPVHLPLIGVVEKASPKMPYLCLQLDIDLGLVAETALARASSESARVPGRSPVHVRGPAPERSFGQASGKTSGRASRALFVGRAGPDLGDALLRLARLLDAPEDAPALAPLYVREIHYRLLASEHGGHIARIACPGCGMRRMAEVIAHINRHFNRPLRLTEMAGMAGMSVSCFHQRFKEMTAFTPLQFQKRLRLVEARRLIAAGGLDAGEVAWRVGYESPSQFNREYARMFGAPPGQDRERLRSAIA